MEWLGNCWHQSSMMTRSLPGTIRVPVASAVSRESRPLTTQPWSVAPGGLGQPSPQRGGGLVDPRTWS
jgi:hypothetical protein